MLDDVYEAVWEDARGREATSIRNDGRELRMSLRGVDLTAHDFDGFSPAADQLALARQRFTLQHECICAGRLEWTMPLAVEHGGQRQRMTLAATLVLGDPLPNGGLSCEELGLELRGPQGVIRSTGTSGWFEDELLEIAAKLGKAGHVRSCLTCAHSDYSPYGHGLFGGLACFRDAKEDYAKVRDKQGLFAIWQRMTEFVQETYLCGEYSVRAPCTGYRG